MSDHYAVVIIGSGPAGLGAAARAARLGLSHLLVERAPHLADTIHKYFRGKLVMAAPDRLELRSDLPFKQGLREEVLDRWERTVATLHLNYRLKTEVTAVVGRQGSFRVRLSDGSEVTADYVVLAVGVQGNIRKLQIPGAELPILDYQLEDPRSFQGREIAVIGNGDAALETTLALAAENWVTLVIRGTEFPRAKPANRSKIQAQLNAGVIQLIANADARRIEPGALILNISGEEDIRQPCEHIIARIGATPLRGFVEAMGVAFESGADEAHPQLSRHYESETVPGLYVIGALGGYPLIKQSLNQGYEVIEYIFARQRGLSVGSYIKSKTEDLIQGKLDAAGVTQELSELLARIGNVPLFSSLSELRILEVLVHSNFRRAALGETICTRGDYAESIYAVLEGEVGVHRWASEDSELIRLAERQFFGEMALLSGRRRTRTVVAMAMSLLIEVDRNTMLRLIETTPEVKRAIDTAAAVRYIKVYLTPNLTDDDLIDEVSRKIELCEYRPGEILIQEGDTADTSLYLIRKGSVTISKKVDGRDVVYAYLAAGNYVGEMALLLKRPRTATVRAAVQTEAICIDSDTIEQLRAAVPGFAEELEDTMSARLAEQADLSKSSDRGRAVDFFAAVELGGATNALVINEALCIRCDNCEKACAMTHDGVSRLVREAGPTFGMIHVPTACRHCEDPHCMRDCPPDAIQRRPTGEISIAQDLCIHCGNCAENCPHSVIRMASPPIENRPRLLRWMLFGLGREPGEGRHSATEGQAGEMLPVKCDLCAERKEGPACVAACPTGAAIRIQPEHFLKLPPRR